MTLLQSTVDTLNGPGFPPPLPFCFLRTLFFSSSPDSVLSPELSIFSVACGCFWASFERFAVIIPLPFGRVALRQKTAQTVLVQTVPQSQLESEKEKTKPPDNTLELQNWDENHEKSDRQNGLLQTTEFAQSTTGKDVAVTGPGSLLCEEREMRMTRILPTPKALAMWTGGHNGSPFHRRMTRPTPPEANTVANTEIVRHFFSVLGTYLLSLSLVLSER